MRLEEDIWQQEDQIRQMVELVNASTISNMGSKTVEGTPYYIVRIDPDVKKLAEIALKQQDFELMEQDLDFESIVRNYSTTIWINKNTFVIQKSEIWVQIEIEPDNQDEKKGSVRMNASIVTKIADINEDFSIELPAEAEQSKDLTKLKEDLEKVSANPASPITGNAIADILQ